MALPRADRTGAAAVLALAVAASALGLAGSARPAGNGGPPQNYVDPAVSPEYPVSDPAADVQGFPGVAFDGTNYLAAWYDYDGASQSLRGGRVSQSGAHLDGMGIGIASNPYALSVAFDGTNYFVVWEATGPSGYPQIRGARVNQAGVVLDPAGITITSSDPYTWQVEPSVAFDGTNYVVVWHVEHNWPPGYESIEARQVSPSGALLDAMGITDRQDEVRPPAIAADSNGNALVVWRDTRAGSAGDIYGARINDGTVLDPNGIPIVTTPDVDEPTVAFDGTNYLVAWTDYRSQTESHIYGARVSETGVVLDPDGGIAISTAAGSQQSPTLAFDGTNYVVSWEDASSGSWDIFGTRFSPEGTVLDGEGVPIATSPTNETAPAATAGSEGRVAISYARVDPEHGGVTRVFLRFFDEGVPPPPPPPPPPPAPPPPPPPPPPPSPPPPFTPPRCHVPKVVGARLAQAKRRIRRAHCHVGRIARKHSTAAKSGRVLSQSPKPGAVRRSGYPVRLVVGRR